MKIIVLNGSPKHNNQSVTMQYIQYFQKKMPEIEFKILNVANQIKRLEKNEQLFQEIVDEIKTAEGIIWGIPLYAMLVSSQFKRFIELIYERNVKGIFQGKYTAILATSIHFFDHTAINYVNAICDDLDMRFVGFFSADTYDLLYGKNRGLILNFAEDFIDAIETKMPTSKKFPQLNYVDFGYTPSKIEENTKINLGEKKLLMVTDSTDEQSNINKMFKRFQDSFASEIEVININDIDIKSGCIGCVKCGYDHQCVYKEKDGFTDFWENKIMKADILIFAGMIIDRYLSSRWKMIFDRAFYMNHTPSIIKKQVGYIISGPLTQIPNLREMLKAYIEFQNSNFVDFITDECGDSAKIDSLLHNLAKQVVKFSKLEYIKPQTFLGIAGTKIFRDDVFGRNRFIFQADHKYYEEHGFYDTFPQNDKRAIEMNKKLIPLIAIEKVRKKMDFKEELVKPFKKLLADPNK